MATEQSPLDRAKTRALRLLAARPRTRAQIRERLAREHLGETADEVLEWLERLGYLDDTAYARARARSFLMPGRIGPRLAERRLVASGIPEATAREAVAEVLLAGGQGAETELCRSLAERRLRGTPPAALDDGARARLARFLLGRGFSGWAVERAIGAHVDRE